MEIDISLKKIKKIFGHQTENNLEANPNISWTDIADEVLTKVQNPKTNYASFKWQNIIMFALGLLMLNPLVIFA